MRLYSSTPGNAALLSSMLFPALISAAGNLNCNEIVAGEKKWVFTELGGPRSVMISHEIPPTLRNTTYTIDICTYLKRPSTIPKEDKCKEGTRVCAIEHTIKSSEDAEEPKDIITEVISIAGVPEDAGGDYVEAKYTRLKDSGLETDAGKEGLRIELNGGSTPERKQKAVVDFLCDPDRIGTETNFIPVDVYEGRDTTITDGEPSLRFVSYDKDVPGTDVDILRLEWYTKHACENQDGGDNTSKSRHWGFFTWFLIIGFLITAAYLIFGSWLNYNRYGARGWDLIPHGDTIRDVPYLLKDWTRRVVNTVQGSGSRGGYSAV